MRPVRSTRRARRPLFRAVASALAVPLTIALVALLALRGTLGAHATLLSAEPAVNDTVAAPPARVRLVFSEELEPTLGRVSLEDAVGRRTALPSKGDPRDVHALIATADPSVAASLAPGAYRVIWRIVSADGHPVQGSYVFHVAGAAPTAARHLPPPAPAGVPAAPEGAPASGGAGPTVGAAPLLPSALRGLAVGVLMALGGLLFYAVGDRARPSPPRAMRVARWLAVAAPFLLAAHLLAWVAHTSPTGAFDAAWLRDATTGTITGRIELARTALALLAGWALLLARRPGLALAFAAAALIASGAVGHSAALHPAFAVPAKAVHLLAAAAWAGGIVWLIAVARGEGSHEAFASRAGRVSAVALGAVVAVTLSGVVQTALFLESPLDLVRSAYGAVVLAKAAGLIVLAMFGAHYRRNVMARLDERDVQAARLVHASFARLLGRELAVMTVVVLLGGLLAYLAPPMRAMPATRAATTTSSDTSSPAPSR